MTATATESYIERLISLKEGELSLLRNHAGGALDRSVEGFDLFTGLWWPLRQQSQRAPRREVAWLVAKLFATVPITHSPNQSLALQLAKAVPGSMSERRRFRFRVDEMLAVPFSAIEPSLQWALYHVAEYGFAIDWVRLVDDLSIWDRGEVQLRWAEEFLNEVEMLEFRS